MDIFFYGTLLSRDKVAQVTGLEESRLWTRVGATLSGYQRFQVRNAEYPGIRPKEGSVVRGLLVHVPEQYTAQVVESLDRYEDIEQVGPPEKPYRLNALRREFTSVSRLLYKSISRKGTRSKLKFTFLPDQRTGIRIWNGPTSHGFLSKALVVNPITKPKLFEMVAEEEATHVENLSPIAHPMAQKKLTKRIFKTIKKASKAKMVRRGVKEVVKSIRKDEKGMVILAGDISPVDVISHLPILCEEAKIPYCYIRSKQELGESSMTKRPTSVIMVLKKDGADYAEAFEECVDEINGLPILPSVTAV